MGLLKTALLLLSMLQANPQLPQSFQTYAFQVANQAIVVANQEIAFEKLDKTVPQFIKVKDTIKGSEMTEILKYSGSQPICIDWTRDVYFNTTLQLGLYKQANSVSPYWQKCSKDSETAFFDGDSIELVAQGKLDGISNLTITNITPKTLSGVDVSVGGFPINFTYDGTRTN